MIDQETQYNRTLKAAQLLIENSGETQGQALIGISGAPLYGGYGGDFVRQMDNGVSFLKEYCTIRVMGPRQSGHSAVASQLARDFKQRCIVISPTSDMMSNVEASCRFTLPTMDKVRDIENIQAVIIDTSCMWKKKEVKRLYQICSTRFTQMRFPFYVIFLQ